MPLKPAAETAHAASLFKKKSRPTTSRNRETSATSAGAGPSSSASTSITSEVVVPTRKAAANPLIQGTKRKHRATGPNGSTGDGDDDDLDYDRGPDVKWKASGRIEDAVAKEREILEGEEAEQIVKKQRRELENEDRLEDGLYHGAASYKQHIKKDKEIPKAMRVGPQKSNNTIRTVTIVDFQPDVCKDYKETGYCGFGDTCKFLHDRGTYLQGWQLDKLAAEPKKQEEESESSDEEDIPWACYVCRKPYTEPIVTKCGHYFCSACAIKRFAKTPKCAACGAPTNGIFNRADKVIEKMRQRKQAKEEEGNNSNDGGGPEEEPDE